MIPSPDHDEDGPDDPTGTHAAHGDVWRDGGWEDDAGFPVPLTTAPACDRTCLPCQDYDHQACGMGCHDEDEEAEQQHLAALEAGSATLITRPEVTP